MEKNANTSTYVLPKTFNERSSTMVTTAVISKCGNYRISYKAEWNSDEKSALVIMFNPSKTTDTMLDKTVMELLNLLPSTQINGETIGSLVVVNMYPYMTPDKKNLSGKRKHYEKENMERIEYEVGIADYVIFAWGSNPNENKMKKKEIEKVVYKAFKNRKDKVKATTDNKEGIAKHPGRYQGKLRIVDYEYQSSQEYLEKN